MQNFYIKIKGNAFVLLLSLIFTTIPLCGMEKANNVKELLLADCIVSVCDSLGRAVKELSDKSKEIGEDGSMPENILFYATIIDQVWPIKKQKLSNDLPDSYVELMEYRRVNREHIDYVKESVKPILNELHPDFSHLQYDIVDCFHYLAAYPLQKARLEDNEINQEDFDKNKASFLDALKRVKSLVSADGSLEKEKDMSEKILNHESFFKLARTYRKGDIKFNAFGDGLTLESSYFNQDVQPRTQTNGLSVVSTPNNLQRFPRNNRNNSGIKATGNSTGAHKHIAQSGISTTTTTQTLNQSSYPSLQEAGATNQQDALRKNNTTTTETLSYSGITQTKPSWQTYNVTDNSLSRSVNNATGNVITSEQTSNNRTSNTNQRGRGRGRGRAGNINQGVIGKVTEKSRKY